MAIGPTLSQWYLHSHFKIVHSNHLPEQCRWPNAVGEVHHASTTATAFVPAHHLQRPLRRETGLLHSVRLQCHRHQPQ